MQYQCQQCHGAFCPKYEGESCPWCRLVIAENEIAHLKACVGKCSEPGAPTYDEIVAESDRSFKRAEAAEKFKTWVHDWLDKHGVPADPDPVRREKTGCRIGCRVDWLYARIAAAEKRAIDLEAHLVEVRWAWVDYKAYLEKKYPPVEPNAFTFTCPHHQKIHALLGADFPARAQAVAEVLEAGLEWLHMEPEKRGPSGANMLLSARLAKLSALDKE